MFMLGGLNIAAFRWTRVASHRYIEIGSMLQRIRRISVVTSGKLFKWSRPDQAAVVARAALRLLSPCSGIHLLLAAPALYTHILDNDNIASGRLGLRGRQYRRPWLVSTSTRRENFPSRLTHPRSRTRCTPVSTRTNSTNIGM
jgi:hypothetical protein